MTVAKLFKRPLSIDSKDHSVAKKVAIAAGTVGSVVAGRAVLPYLLTKAANFGLSKVPGYHGHIERLEFQLWRGLISFRGVSIEQSVNGHDMHLLDVARIAIHVDWKHLFTGGLIGDLIVDRPRVSMDIEALQQQKLAQTSPGSQNGVTHEPKASWQQKLRDLVAFQFNVSIHDGEFHVAGLQGQGDADLRIEDFDLSIENITNSTQLSETLMSRLECQARVLSQGHLMIHGEGYPLAEKPTLNIDLTLEGVPLHELNSFARHYAGVQIKNGSLSTHMEAGAKEGKLMGYVKPVIDRLELERVKHQSIATMAEATAIEAAVKLLESRKEDRIATRVDFDGDMSDPNFDITGTVGLALKNAFIEALGGHFENRIWIERAGKDASDTEFHFRKPKRSHFRKIFELVKDTVMRWTADEAPKMSAALSYYTAFSLAPLLLLVIAIAGLVFGRDAAQGQIVNQLTGLVGQQSANALQSMIQAANQPTKGVIATIISIISLIGGASGVLSELKDGLNKVWRTDEPSGITALVKQNLKFFGIIAAIGFLLLVSLAISAGLAAAGKMVGGAFPIPEFVMHVIDFVISWAIISGLFAIMFKVLPNVVIPWKDVGFGAIATGLLFSIGKLILGVYLGKGTVGSSYGAAGSVLIVLLWVYYSGLILYFGAELTRVYSEQYGSRQHEPEAAPQMKKAA